MDPKTKLFKVSQKAVIKNVDKFLIVKNTPDSTIYPNHWDLPGGRLESGEDLKEGLEREVFDETGLKIEIIKPVFTFHELVTGHHEAVFILYLSKIVSGEIRLSDEHTEYRWAMKEEILKLETENYLKAYLRAVSE